MVHLFNKNPTFDAIEFGKPIKGGDGKYFISASVLVDEESKDITCQFGPELKSKTTLNEKSTSIELKIPNEQISEFIKDCDDHFIGLAKENKDSWFPNQNITDNYLEQAFMPSLKTAKKETTIKCKLAKKCVAFNTSKEEIDIGSVSEGAKVSIIANVAGLWFTKTRFGLTWMINQIKINNVENKKQMECLFNDEEEDLSEVFPDD